MVLGTSGHHPGHCRTVVRARPRRWDVRLLGAPCQWCEAAREGYAPPCEIGRHHPLGRPLGHGPAAVQEILPFAAMVAADDSHHPFRVADQPVEGEREAGGEGDNRGAVVVEVHGGEGAPIVWQIANREVDCPVARRRIVRIRGRKLWGPPPWLAAPILVRARGGGMAVSLGPCQGRRLTTQRRGCAPFRAIVPDILLDQGAQCVEREVFGLCFGQGRGCAEWMRSSAKWA